MADKSIYKTIRPLLFRLNGEQSHNLSIGLLNLAGRFPFVKKQLTKSFAANQQGPEVKAFGLTFKNPIGLAAGYDKDGLAWRGLSTLGFGHLELGTVSPRPQPGNPGPRIFRLVEDQAVINRMGFPNRGADFMLRQLQHPKPPGVIIGMNIGKNKKTPLNDAINDYVYLLEKFSPVVDYLAINISSPNTPDLRKLQQRDYLTDLLTTLQEVSAAQKRSVPLVVKLAAPDMNNQELEDALDIIINAGMSGVIISNTVLSRPGLKSSHKTEIGGLSGRPLLNISAAMVHKVHRLTNGKLPIIASGGIMRPEDAQIMLDAGATLVQLYTGLIYGGPWLVRDILNTELLQSHRLPQQAMQVEI